MKPKTLMEQVIGSIEFKAEIHQLKEQRRIQREQEIADNRERLTRLYCELTDEQILDVLKAERDIAQCQNCRGLPCSKRLFSAEIVPSIGVEDGVLVIRYGQCATARKFYRQQRIAKRLHSAHIPDKYIGKTFADYVVDRNNADAVTYAKSALQTRKGAFLYGNCGTGKTFLAALVALDFINAGKSVVFVKVPSLLADIRNTFSDNSKLTEAQLVAEAVDADLLVLDDFGMEKPTKFAGTTLCSIIDARYDREGLTTIITSNYPPEQIRHELDNPTDGKSYNGSRIFDRCQSICRPVLLKGNSRRR